MGFEPTHTPHQVKSPRQLSMCMSLGVFHLPSLLKFQGEDGVAMARVYVTLRKAISTAVTMKIKETVTVNQPNLSVDK